MAYVKLQVEFDDADIITRRLNNLRSLTPAQARAIQKGIQSFFRGRYNRWPRKGGGIKGNATGYSRNQFKVQMVKVSEDQYRFIIKNTARAKGAGGARTGDYYAAYREAGIPNRRTEGDLRKGLKQRIPAIANTAMRRKVL